MENNKYLVNPLILGPINHLKNQRNLYNCVFTVN